MISPLTLAFLSFLNIVTLIYGLPASQDVLKCLDSSQVPYAISSSPNWKNLSAPFNLRLQYEPAVITIPTDESEVQASVTCASKAGLKVQAKGGGHSYASFSSGGQDGSLIIEMENFDEITVDQSTFIAKVGAGQRLGNVAEALYAQGKRALPHGTCAGVGIAGHALHGGYGYDSRIWGLALDHIVGLDVVLANGTLVHTNFTSFPDIFYAMRGAGDSFGIATTFYFATEEAPDYVLWYTANVAASLEDVSTVSSAFEKFQTWTLTSPLLTINNSYGFYVDNTGAFIIRGWCMECDPVAFNNTVFPAMLDGFGATDISVQQQDWIEALTTLAAPDSLSQPLGSGYQEHDTFYAKSLVVTDDVPLSQAAIQSFWAYVIDNITPDSVPWFSIINLYGSHDSVINNPPFPIDSASYSDRGALWVFQNYGYTPNNLPPWDDSITGVIDGLNDAVTNAQPNGNFTGYLNYVDPDLSPALAAAEYYGSATYDKLLWLKAQLDPTFLFYNPQSVGNAPAF